MCVVFHFTPGSMIPKEQFFNAVYNNPDGWGLILKDGNKQLQVLRDCPEGGNDPEVLWQLIEKNKDIDRALHIRHATKGGTNLENCHPFEAYISDTRQVYFMHNGTLSSYGTGYTSYGSNYGRVTSTPERSGKSDSLDFCEKVLQPALQFVVGENGRADYHNDMFKKLILEKNWSHGSKGLLFSNDMEPLYHGAGWEEYSKDDEYPVFVSNKDYFKEVKRGPFFEKKKAEEARFQEAQRQAEAKERAKNSPLTSSTSGTSGAGSNHSDVMIFSEERLLKSVAIVRAMGGMFLDADLNTLSGCAKLAGVDLFEWEELLKVEENYYIATVISQICDQLHQANLKNIELEEDNKRYQASLKTLNLKVKEMERAEAPKLKRVG